ncbi:MAG: ABC transporter permease [Planctomycetota bacterium]|jgi:ribose transport system permease protein
MPASADAPAAEESFWESIDWKEFFSKYGTVVFFVVLIVFNAFVTPRFLSPGTLKNTLVQVFPVMLVALGMTMVISSGGIDISVGAIMAVAGAVTARLYTSGVGLVPSLLCSVVAACLCGLVNGVMVARFRIQPIIVTLVVMIAGRGLAQIILGEPVTSLSYTPLEDFGRYWVGGVVPIQVVLVGLMVGAMYFVARKTNFAKRVEAIGDNPRAARLVGINTALVTVGVYVLCAFLCAVAGNMEAARTSCVDIGDLGVLIELDAIAAVAIGGTPFSGGRPRILGTALGAIVVQLVTIVVNMNDIPSDYSLIFKAVIVVIALWAQRKR